MLLKSDVFQAFDIVLQIHSFMSNEKGKFIYFVLNYLIKCAALDILTPFAFFIFRFLDIRRTNYALEE